MVPFLALLIVAASIGLVARRVEIRLVLLGAATYAVSLAAFGFRPRDFSRKGAV